LLEEKSVMVIQANTMCSLQVCKYAY